MGEKVKTNVEKKKGSRLWIILVIVVALLILLGLYRFVFVWVMYPEPSATDPDIDFEDLETGNVEPNDETVNEKEYKTSDQLSEITLSRSINDEGLEAEFDIVFKGYVQEIDPAQASGIYGEQTFVLSNGRARWSIQAEETNEGTNCLYEYSLSGTGEDAFSNLDVLYEESNGMDEDDNLVHLDDWGTIYLAFSPYGYGSSGKPEVSFSGKLLVPVDMTESITVSKPSPNVDAICDGYTSSTTFDSKGTVDVRVPLVLSNIVASDNQYEGNAQLEEAMFGEGSGGARFNNIVLAGTDPITIIPDENLWTVTWKIYLP